MSHDFFWALHAEKAGAGFLPTAAPEQMVVEKRSFPFGAKGIFPHERTLRFRV